MYICNCNGINDKQAKEASKAGCKKPMDIFEFYGKSVHCGKCCMELREIIKSEKENS